MTKNPETIFLILKEIFPSDEMAFYLGKRPLSQEQLGEAVAGAAIPLKRKLELFLLLAQKEESPFFSSMAEAALQAIREMQPKPGEFFYLKSFYYEESVFPTERALESFLTWEHIFERVQEYQADDELMWFVVEKWEPDGSGRLKNHYDYTIVNGEVCYFYCDTLSRWEYEAFGESRNLNLPVPFVPGDLVTVDCRPFAPVSHGVILEVGDNQDCCCLQMLFRQNDGAWDTGAVKHGHIFPGGCSLELSPLYRLASFKGELPQEERMLEKVSQYVNGDEKRGAGLWNYLYRLRGMGRDKRGVTEEQILSYMERGREA